MSSFIKVSLITSAVVMLSACNVYPEQRAANESQEVAQLRAQVANQEAQIAKEREEKARLESELRGQGSMTTAMSSNSAAAGGNMPFNARPGECYARVITPAKFETKAQKVLVSEASQKVNITPAKYAPTTKRVIVKEATTKLEVVPATYKTVTERVIVEPAKQKIISMPAKYRTVTEKVLDKPAYTTWKSSSDLGQGTRGSSADASVLARQVELYQREGLTVLDSRIESTGEVMCLVEVPATYRTVTRKVLESPATTKTIEQPAKYRTVTKQVVDRPATTRQVTIPAQYKTITVQQEVAPAKSTVTPIPAKYDTVKKTVKISNESINWVPVLCAANLTKQNVSAVQRALLQQAPSCWTCQRQVDGVMGQCTYQAAQCYARQNNLPAGKDFLTIGVVKALGVQLQ